MVDYYNKFLEFANRICTYICISCLTLIFSVMFAQVIFRYVFNNSIGWADELSRFLLIWISFLGVSIVVWHKGHLKILFFVKILPKKLNKIIIYLADIINIIFLSTAFYFSFYAVKLSFGHSLIGLPLNWGLAYISFPIGMGLSILYYINFIIQKKGSN